MTPTPKTARDELLDEVAWEMGKDLAGYDTSHELAEARKWIVECKRKRADAILSLVGKRVVGVVESYEITCGPGEPRDNSQNWTSRKIAAALRELFGTGERE